MASAFNKISKSSTSKVLFIGFLVLLLLIPMGMIESIIAERSRLYRSASDDITASWGDAQLIMGPVLTLPYMENDINSTEWRYKTKYHHIKPSHVKVDTQINTQVRYRGIYEVPVYVATISITGRFSMERERKKPGEPEKYKLDEGIIQIPIKNGRSLKKMISFVWDDQPLELIPDKSGPGGITFSAKLQGYPTKTTHRFQMNFELSGSDAVSFYPLGHQTQINARANWGSPGFFGSYLPSKYEITDNNFSAEWSVNDLFGSMEYENTATVTVDWYENGPLFGIRMVPPVDTYRMMTRASTYAVLFIGLTYLIYFMTEIFNQIKFHTVQYLFVGFANSVFYLLLLSLAELINFTLAYVISASGSIGLICLYSTSILKNRIQVTAMFATLSSLYVYLFITLKSEAYALLLGSIGLFAILAMIMYLTRNINWYRIGNNDE